MENVFLTSLTVPEIKKMFRDEIENYFESKILKPEQPNPDFLTLPEAADYLRVKPQTVYGYVHRKQIAYSKRGKFLYFRKSDLSDFIAVGQRQTSAESNSDAETAMIEANRNKMKNKVAHI